MPERRTGHHLGHNGRMDGHTLIDLHTHSNVSDGTDTPAQLVAAAASRRLGVIGLCDHDTMAGVPPAKETGRQLGVFVLRGVEISAVLHRVTVHLLGYGCDPDNEALREALDDVRAGRTRRLDQMIAALQSAGLPIGRDEVLAQVGPNGTIGRPHVADALVAAGIVANRRQAFDTWLGEGCPGYVPHRRIELANGIKLVQEAGGAAVLAHAWGRSARAVLGSTVIEGLAQQDGLDGLEVDHNDHDEPDRSALRALAQRAGLIITGSSDYHGTGKIGHDLACNTTDPQQYRAIVELVEARGGRP